MERLIYRVWCPIFWMKQDHTIVTMGGMARFDVSLWVVLLE